MQKLATIVLPAAVAGIAGLAARDATPAAFDARCIPGNCVAPRSHTDGILARHALSAGRSTRLGAPRELHHGPLAPDSAPRKSPDLYYIDTEGGQSTLFVLLVSAQRDGSSIVTNPRNDFSKIYAAGAAR